MPGFERRISPQALNQFLTFLWVPEPGCMLEGISKLPGGHYAIFERGQLKVTQYWDLHFPAAGTNFPLAEDDLAEMVRLKFMESVRRQIVSDRPVGAFLSAGVDSSSIVSVLASMSAHPVRTYTVTFPKADRVGQKTLDDPAVARNTARYFGCEHHEIVMEPKLEELWPYLIWHLDDPTADPAIVAAYAVCREAQSTSTVLLSGVGGDELFAGYRKHYAYRFARKYQHAPAALRRILEQAALSMPTFSGTRLQGFMRLLQKMARGASLEPHESFLVSSTYLFEEQKHTLCTEELTSRMNGGNGWSTHQRHFDEVRDADFLNQMLYLDSKTFMPSLNLNYNDKMSMAASIELRVPFLDVELAEFVAANVSPEMKLKGNLRPTTKYIFRRAMEGLLPAEVLRQPKAGFGAPLNSWVRRELNTLLDDVLSEESLNTRGFFRPDAVRQLRQQTNAGNRDWAMQIWQLATIELWCRTFLDGGDRKFVERTLSTADAMTNIQSH